MFRRCSVEIAIAVSDLDDVGWAQALELQLNVLWDCFFSASSATGLRQLAAIICVSSSETINLKQNVINLSNISI